MQLKFWQYDLKLTHPWAIARNAARGGTAMAPVAMLQLTGEDGVIGLGESAPSSRCQENTAGSLAFLAKVDARKLSFDDVEASMRYVEGVEPGQLAAKSALNSALLDGAARKAGQPIYDFLGLGFREKHHVSSYSIGIDRPEIIHKKVVAAESYPVLKLKVGVADDELNLAALRAAAPKKWLRVDANEGWQTREYALQQIEWFAADGRVQFIEQPMPAAAPLADLIWLKERSPLPLMGDESFISAEDVPHCAESFHGVSIKLCKTGGVTRARRALQAARDAGLKTMLSCMIETSINISAAAHLAELADYLDLDGNLLVTNDPYAGVSCRDGILSFADAPAKTGLCAAPRA